MLNTPPITESDSADSDTDAVDSDAELLSEEDTEREYHPHINGMLQFYHFCLICLRIYYLCLLLGTLCDETGDPLPSDSEPPPRTAAGPHDWTPFED